MAGPAYRPQRPAALLLIILPLVFAACTEDDDHDITSPDANPPAFLELAGQLRLPSTCHDAAALGDFVFVAGGQAGLHVVRLLSPTTPYLVKRLDTVKFAQSVQVVESRFEGARIDVALIIDGTESILTFDVTDPVNAYSFNQGTTMVNGSNLFVQAAEDPSEPYVVFLAENWKGIRIFESNPQYPGVLDYGGVFSYTQGFAKDVVVRDELAYVADGQMGLAVLDVHDLVLGGIELISWVDTPGNASALALAEDIAFVADGHKGLTILSISDPYEPTLVSRSQLDGDCVDLDVFGEYAFLAAGAAGVHIVNVSDPRHPNHVGTYPTSGANGIEVTENGSILVADEEDGLLVLQLPESN